MKKKILIFVSIIGFFLVAMAVLPFIFKDKIFQKIDQEIAKNVNAQVFYDYNQIQLSLFRRFPHISATLNDFGIVGNPPFQNDTLIYVNSFRVDLNLWSVIFDEYPSLKGLKIDGGKVHVRVLESGLANYDITYPTEEIEEPSNFRMAIDYIDVEDLNIIYDDHSLNFYMRLENTQMTGNADFTADVFDLPLEMTSTISSLSYEGSQYLSKKSFSANTTLNVDLTQMKFGLKEGDFRLNDFLFGLEGFIAMPSEDIVMDLQFAAKETSFKNVLSLVPGIYNDSFNNLKTSGSMAFSGFVKGIYNDQSMPAYLVDLKIKDGMFQYPDLPKPVKEVNVDLKIENKTSTFENTKIDIPMFSMVIGTNPISGKLIVENLKNYPIDANLKGNLNLEELTSIFPIDGNTLKGNLVVDALAKGIYDEVTNQLPVIDAKINLTNGYVKNNEYPVPLEKLYFKSSITNPSGNMNDFLVDLSQFGFEIDKDEVEGRLIIRDFSSMTWEGMIKGGVDLAKVLAIFPMDNLIMEGKLSADLMSKGSYKDVDNGRFDKIDTRGSFLLSNFFFTSSDLPQGIRIHSADANFTPTQINLNKFDSRVGESTLAATGSLKNYLNYLLKDNEKLTGQLTLNSPKFNVNQWLSDGPNTESTGLEVLDLPKNIDFTMSVMAGEVLYDNLTLRNMIGNLRLNDGVMTFQNASFNTLGGAIVMNGSYDPRDLAYPAFDLKLNLTDISVQESFQAFNTVKVLAPVAQHFNGKFSTNLDLSGKLGVDMMPILSTLDGKGLFKILEGNIQNSPILQGLMSFTKIQKTNNLNLKNLVMQVEIEEGLLHVKPFDLQLWDFQANVQGTTGFDGTINYLVNMQVPAGQFGQQANQALARISNTDANLSTMIPLALTFGGSYNSPKIGLAGGNSIESLLANALKSRLSQEKENLVEKATATFQAKEDSLKRELKAKAEVLQDSAKREAERKVSGVKTKVADEAKSRVKGLINSRTRTTPDTTNRQN
jgi:hypothetical protein